MHGPEHEYATVIGPRPAVQTLIETWARFQDTIGFDLESPRLIELGFESAPGAVRERFYETRAPAVAVLKHPSAPGLGAWLTARLQIETMILPPLSGEDFPLAGGMPALLWEPAYQAHAAQGGPHVDPFTTGKLDDLIASGATFSLGGYIMMPPVVGGHRVALLDTGDMYANRQMIDFLDGDFRDPATAAAADPHGHGTAVSMVITAMNPNAIIHPLRVLNHKGTGSSHEILAGLTYAMWSGQYDLINASLTTDVSNPCDSTYGRSIDYLARYCHANGVETPMLVAAAGNSNGAPSGYPARMRDAIVALATDQDNNLQPYNSLPAAPTVIARAYGGSATDPLGDLGPLTGLTGPGASLWGTSLAAAVVSGACLPP